ncbi:MAG: amidohydrolase family protein [Gemmatimonadota bacterium]|jgi:imidazolonepropionase-like amidohydrolase
MTRTFAVAAALVGLARAVPSLDAQTPAAPVRTIALVGATVVDGTGAPPLADAVVVVEGDRIACVGSGSACAVPDGAERVELSGRWLTPGLVDAHVHFSQTGWHDGRPDGIAAPSVYPYDATARALRANPERWFRSYLCSGITAVFDVGGHPWTTDLPARAEGDPSAPHVRAAGPLVTWVSNDALDVDDELYTFLPMGHVEEARESVRTLEAMGAGAVKVWYLRPPPERRAELDAILMEIGDAARAAGLDLIVHATSLREAKQALRAGASMLVHSVQDRPVDDEFLDLLRRNDAIYGPTLVVGRNWSRAWAAAALGLPYDIDDPGGCVDPETRRKIADVERLRPFVPERLRSSRAAFERLEASGAGIPTMAENLRRVHGSGATVVVATDAGNPLTLHGPSIYREMEAMQRAGLEPGEIVVAATRNGARALGRRDDLGTLEAGKIADLLVLAEDPLRDVRAFRTVRRVMRAGVLHAREGLAW